MTIHIIRNDRYEETYLVDEFGREVCEHCGGPYETFGVVGWQHEDDCPLTSTDNDTTVTE